MPLSRISAKVIFLGAGRQVLVHWLGFFADRRALGPPVGAWSPGSKRQ
jgi:hypothetical protein